MKFHRHTVTHTALVTVISLLAAWGLLFLTVLMIQPGGVTETLRMFWQDKLLIPLNAFPILAVLLVCYWIVGNPFAAAGTAGLIVNLLSYVNLVKTDCRNDPFIPADIGLVREAVNAAGEYTLNLHIGTLAGILVLGALCFLLAAVFRVKHPRWQVRVIGAVAVLGAFVWSVPKVYQSVELYTPRGENLSKSNVPEVFRLCGFPYCFLHNYDLYPIEKPEGYQKSTVEQWAEEDAAEYTKPGVQPNVIFIMCESYSDLSDEAVFQYAEEDNPMYGFHRLAASDRARSGHIVVSNYGAGTANTEFDVLTGIQTNMVSPNNVSSFRVIHKSINALPWDYQAAGYETYFTHPGYSWFYNRQNVNGYLGFQDSWFTENHYGDLVDPTSAIYHSDDILTDELFAQLKERVEDGPCFSFSVSYQNHGPYEWAAPANTEYVTPEGSGLDQESCNIWNHYLSGVGETIAAMNKLTQDLDSLDEPVVLVLFGDHKPWGGNGNSAYAAMGLTFDLGSLQGFYDYYATPYLIWANRAAKEVLGADFTGDGGDFSPCFLMTRLFDACGWAGPGYMQLSRAMRDISPLLHTNGLFLHDGVLTSVLSDTDRSFYRSWLAVQYYREHVAAYS